MGEKTNDSLPLKTDSQEIHTQFPSPSIDDVNNVVRAMWDRLPNKSSPEEIEQFFIDNKDTITYGLLNKEVEKEQRKMGLPTIRDQMGGMVISKNRVYREEGLKIVDENLDEIMAIDSVHSNERSLTLVSALARFGNPERTRRAVSSLEKHVKDIQTYYQKAYYSRDWNPVPWEIADILLISEDQEVRKLAEERIQEVILGDPDPVHLRDHTIENIVKTENPDLFLAGIREIGNMFGADGLDLYYAWIEDVDLEYVKRGHISLEKARLERVGKHLNAMINLEKKEKGSVEALYKIFGIRSFDRYPQEVLLRQYTERDNFDLPYGVVLSARYDHNGAISNTRPYSQFADALDQRYLVRYVECADKREVLTRLHRLGRRYGQHHKVSFLLAHAHGSEDSIAIGGFRKGFRGFNRAFLTVKDLETTAENVKDLFIEQPIFVFSACKTGRKGGIASKTPLLFNAKYYAPKSDAGTEKIEPVMNENGKLVDVKVKYSKGSTATNE